MFMAKGITPRDALGEHVRRLTLLRPTAQKIECSPGLQPDWFAATIGGMGLTGLIVDAQIQLRRVSGPWLDTESCIFGSLDEFFRLSAQSEDGWEYSVAWIDCANRGSGGARGVFFRGNHSVCRDEAAPAWARTFPVTPPFSLVNAFSLRLFNQTYFQAHRIRQGRGRQHYLPFFFPLDNILGYSNSVSGAHGLLSGILSVRSREGGGGACGAVPPLSRRPAPVPFSPS